MRHIIGAVGMLFVLLPFSIAAQPVALRLAHQVPDANLQTILKGISQSESVRDARVKEYTRIQHYWATSSRFGESADMVVRMHYVRDHGKDYVVLSRTGPSSVQTRVFDKLLHLEVESALSAAREATLFTTSHYRFRVIGTEMMNGKNCYVLELDPLQPDKYLVSGKAWVDVNENAIVRVEGRPSSSLSFWVGRPNVVEEFGKFGDFWFATMRDSVASSFLLGTCQLRVDYADYKVIAP